MQAMFQHDPCTWWEIVCREACKLWKKLQSWIRIQENLETDIDAKAIDGFRFHSAAHGG
jgi:hypothetical protein